MNRNAIKTDSAAKLLFDRLDRAGLAAGINPEWVFSRRRYAINWQAYWKKRLLDHARREACRYPESFENKTIIIECARGGPDGASMPLTGTFGYQYSLPMFCPEILENSVILYIWVTLRESRHRERGQSGSKRSRFQPASRSANGGNAGRLWL